MKSLIFDAGPLINFSMNGLLDVLEKIHNKTKVEFLITKEVKFEIIDKPLDIKRFKLGALRLRNLFDKGVLKHADLNDKEVNNLRKIREKLMQTANNTFKTSKKFLHLLDKGECATFALAKIIEEKTGNMPVLVIDERTARMLCENPENLRRIFENKLHASVKANKDNYRYFNNFRIIRSVELAYVSYKKGLIDLKGLDVLGGILYGLKFKGCSVSEEEIENMIRMN